MPGALVETCEIGSSPIAPVTDIALELVSDDLDYVLGPCRFIVIVAGLAKTTEFFTPLVVPVFPA